MTLKWGDSEATVAKVIDIKDFPDLPMPASAKHMILHYLKVGRYNDKLQQEAENV